MNIWVASLSWLWWIILLRTQEYKYLFKSRKRYFLKQVAKLFLFSYPQYCFTWHQESMPSPRTVCMGMRNYADPLFRPDCALGRHFWLQCCGCWFLAQLSYCKPLLKMRAREFPGGPVLRPQCFQYRAPGFNPCSGSWDPISHVVWPNRKKKGWGESYRSLFPSLHSSRKTVQVELPTAHQNTTVGAWARLTFLEALSVGGRSVGHLETGLSMALLGPWENQPLPMGEDGWPKLPSGGSSK